jgi:hypothetical protein
VVAVTVCELPAANVPPPLTVPPALGEALTATVYCVAVGVKFEVLALMPLSFDLERGVVAIRTLKRRRHHVRELPLPPSLIEALDRHFGLSAGWQNVEMASRRLWPWRRETAWKIIKQVMNRAGVVERAYRRGSCLRTRASSGLRASPDLTESVRRTVLPLLPRTPRKDFH